jgi:uncharacterized Zn finger protein
MTDEPRDVVAECLNCHTTSYHRVVQSEAFDGAAYRCTSCSVTKEGVQLTLQATVLTRLFSRDEGGR